MSEAYCCPLRRFQLTADDWTPIIAPIDCSYFAIFPLADGNNMLRSSDPENSAAWHEVAGYAFIVPSQSSAPRWPAGSTVTWLKAKTGSPIAVVEFIAA